MVDLEQPRRTVGGQHGGSSPMALIALVATSAADMATFGDTLDRLIDKHTLNVQAVLPVASPSKVTAAADVAVDAAAGVVARPDHVSGWRPLYTAVAKAIGSPELATAQRDIVKRMLKERTAVPMSDIVAALDGSSPSRSQSEHAVSEPPAPQVDPAAVAKAARMAELQAEMAALNGAGSRAATTETSTVKLDSMPATSDPLSVKQCSALQAWSGNFEILARKEAILAYTGGEMTWPQVVAVFKGSDPTDKALRKVNAAA